MAVKISGIEAGSYAELLGIAKGETLISINGHEITDVLDFRFYETNSLLEIGVRDAFGGERTVKLKKRQYESVGFVFDTYLIDKERSCRNKCIFCFIDQLPKGMRKSLYFKDDDSRLSFLFGNYITLTNIDEKEIRRIIEMRISPINISVQTMNPELRCKMMNNRFAGQALRFVKMLADAEIMLNCQLVLCPGINDGDELRFSLTELMKLGESIQSVACVPVGLTRYREGLFPLESYNAVTAGEVIDIITECGDKMKELHGSRTFFPSDEFFILAGRELPPYEFYEDYAQIENGVGMIRNLEDEFRFAMEGTAPERFTVSRHIALVTGTSVYPFIQNLVDELCAKCDNLTVDVYAVKNEFFGGKINVTGLITGSDIILALKNKELFDELLIPASMLKADEDIFLDDITLAELSEKLNVNIGKSGNSGEDMLNSILGIAGERGQTNMYRQVLDF